MQIGEHENKFILPNYRSSVVRNFLARQCSPDPSYAEGIVSSIYFDTQDGAMLGEKLNSDFQKTKIRLRWYSSIKTQEPYSELYLEIKVKIGSARKKKRHLLPLKSSWAIFQPLHNSCYFQINKLLLTHGIYFGQPLFPVIQINYRRSRYIDSLSGARLSIDSDIHVGRINNRQMTGYSNKTPLKYAVFEHKSRVTKLPDWLHRVNTIGDCRKSSFSKYSMCIAHLQERQN